MAKRATAGRSGPTNLGRLLKAKVVNPRNARRLKSGAAKVEKLTKNEIKALIAVRRKVSRKRFQPKPDGSIF